MNMTPVSKNNSPQAARLEQLEHQNDALSSQIQALSIQNAQQKTFIQEQETNVQFFRGVAARQTHNTGVLQQSCDSLKRELINVQNQMQQVLSEKNRLELANRHLKSENQVKEVLLTHVFEKSNQLAFNNQEITNRYIELSQLYENCSRRAEAILRDLEIAAINLTVFQHTLNVLADKPRTTFFCAGPREVVEDTFHDVQNAVMQGARGRRNVPQIEGGNRQDHLIDIEEEHHVIEIEQEEHKEGQR